jgi:hypothetical protein
MNAVGALHAEAGGWLDARLSHGSVHCGDRLHVQFDADRLAHEHSPVFSVWSTSGRSRLD